MPVPFLGSHLDVRLGAFHLGRTTGCTLVPFFVSAAPRPPRFRLEFFRPLDVGAEDLRAPVTAFVDLYARHARREPWQLPHRSSGRLLG